MSTTKALIKLYKAITGSASTRNSTAKIINDLADNWPAELPAYTSSDSGKVLAVKSDGTLEWKTLS